MTRVRAVLWTGMVAVVCSSIVAWWTGKDQSMVAVDAIAGAIFLMAISWAIAGIVFLVSRRNAQRSTLVVIAAAVSIATSILAIILLSD